MLRAVIYSSLQMQVKIQCISFFCILIVHLLTYSRSFTSHTSFIKNIFTINIFPDWLLSIVLFWNLLFIKKEIAIYFTDICSELKHYIKGPNIFGWENILMKETNKCYVKTFNQRICFSNSHAYEHKEAKQTKMTKRTHLRTVTKKKDASFF